jgi:hypothetical protein
MGNKPLAAYSAYPNLFGTSPSRQADSLPFGDFP